MANDSLHEIRTAGKKPRPVGMAVRDSVRNCVILTAGFGCVVGGIGLITSRIARTILAGTLPDFNPLTVALVGSLVGFVLSLVGAVFALNAALRANNVPDSHINDVCDTEPVSDSHGHADSHSDSYGNSDGYSHSDAYRPGNGATAHGVVGDSKQHGVVGIRTVDSTPRGVVLRSSKVEVDPPAEFTTVCDGVFSLTEVSWTGSLNTHGQTIPLSGTGTPPASGSLDALLTFTATNESLTVCLKDWKQT